MKSVKRNVLALALVLALVVGVVGVGFAFVVEFVILLRDISQIPTGVPYVESPRQVFESDQNPMQLDLFQTSSKC
jgi:hypothetical protein